MSRSIGENYLEEEEHIKVIGVGDVKAGDIILKCGRTTGTTKGKVSQVSVLQWQNGILTSEIAVVAYLPNSNESFARNGDSGALAVRLTATNSEQLVWLWEIPPDQYGQRLLQSEPSQILYQEDLGMFLLNRPFVEDKLVTVVFGGFKDCLSVRYLVRGNLSSHQFFL